MPFIDCPVKKKKVYITRTKKDAGNFENPNETTLGIKICSDNDYLCEHDKCPMKKEAL